MAAATIPSWTGPYGRARRLILAPDAEWIAIAAEPLSERDLMGSYAAPLAAVPPIAFLLGQLAEGRDVASAIVRGALGGRRDRSAGLKLVVFSLTPFWLGGVFLIAPLLYPLVWLASLYGLVLLLTGAPRLLGLKGERTVMFAILMLVVLEALYGVGEGVLWSASFWPTAG